MPDGRHGFGVDEKALGESKRASKKTKIVTAKSKQKHRGHGERRRTQRKPDSPRNPSRRAGAEEAEKSKSRSLTPLPLRDKGFGMTGEAAAAR